MPKSKIEGLLRNHASEEVILSQNELRIHSKKNILANSDVALRSSNSSMTFSVSHNSDKNGLVIKESIYQQKFLIKDDEPTIEV